MLRPFSGKSVSLLCVDELCTVFQDVDGRGSFMAGIANCARKIDDAFTCESEKCRLSGTLESWSWLRAVGRGDSDARWPWLVAGVVFCRLRKPE